MTHDVNCLHATETNEGSYNHHDVYSSLMLVLAFHLSHCKRSPALVVLQKPLIQSRTTAESILGHESAPPTQISRPGSLVLDELVSLVDHHRRLAALRSQLETLKEARIKAEAETNKTKPTTTALVHGLPFRAHKVISPTRIRLNNIKFKKILGSPEETTRSIDTVPNSDITSPKPWKLTNITGSGERERVIPI